MGGVSDWSRDGRFLALTDLFTKTKSDLWIFPLEGDRKPFPFLATESNEGGGKFSSDGRWIAYESDETGRTEIYVRRFSAVPAKESDGKWQISSGGGSQVQWRRDGKELFYLAADNKLMVVPITAVATFQAGAPSALFALPSASGPVQRKYSVAGNGTRILVNVGANDAVTAPIQVFVNWFSTINQ
jgi:eukaryotic-like serine/threonine-protein kinase